MQVEAAVQSVEPVAAFSDADMQALFEASDKPMQLAALSQQEMVETEGALIWKPFVGRAIIGGLAIGATFIHNQWDFNRGWCGFQTVNWARVGGATAIEAGFGVASRHMVNRGWF